MTKKTFTFSSAEVKFFLNTPFDHIDKLVEKESTFIITDENVFLKHKAKFKGRQTIVIKAGEQYKNQYSVNSIIEQLVEKGADRKSFLIGVGGGVVTDITGFVAGIYMRGIKFSLVPTSLLAMVDAAIGGKTGIDVGVYKNMVGLFNQPQFLLYDISFLKTLPKEEWINGFAEIIKHAAIKNPPLFTLLEENKLTSFTKDFALLAKLIQTNVLIKAKVVTNDPFEAGERKLLNFGHTLGHAIENLYQLPHGHAISIGMVAAAKFSQQKTGFNDTERLTRLFTKYGLPVSRDFNKEKALQILAKDKKKDKQSVSFVLLNKIGKASVHPLTLSEIDNLVQQL
ncbi:MAG: aroB [Segetibacter sp.]|nr:aroB [Segetibacter sp.]